MSKEGQMEALMVCAREIDNARTAADSRGRVGWRSEIAGMREHPADVVCASFAEHLLVEDDEARISIDRLADTVGFHMHERAQTGWRGLFDMLVLTSRYAGLTGPQTRRRGLDLIGDEAPEAVVARFDQGLEHLKGLSDLLELGRCRLKMAIEGVLQPA